MEEVEEVSHLDGGVGGGVADAYGAAAHRGRDVAAVEVSHGASFFLCLELQVGLGEGGQWSQGAEPDNTCREGEGLSGAQYLCSQVQDQVFDHLPKGFGQSQQLVEEVVASSEAHDVHHPHALQGEPEEEAQEKMKGEEGQGVEEGGEEEAKGGRGHPGPCLLQPAGGTLTPFLVQSAERAHAHAHVHA